MKRFRFGLAALVVAVSAAAFAAGPAAAYDGSHPAFDPQTGNVPYLAWRGEELRLVKCSEDISGGQDVDWIVEDWSGYPFQPPSLETSTVRFFQGTGEHAEEGCVKADYVSLKAGLAMIKLVVADGETGNPILKHQFLAGWLGLNTPVISEVSATSQPGGGGVLGDPLGDGQFVPNGAPGRVQVQVTGSLPLGNNFTELGLPPSINLPTEADGSTYWDDLARAMATTSSTFPNYRDNPWWLWDIHDDRTTAEGHIDTSPAAGHQSPCAVPFGPETTVDSVDACLGAGFFLGDGAYSRVFHDDPLSLDPTFGPFDPLRPDETLLSDGKLDDGDVPMPSARVDVSIAANSGAPDDISGVGSLVIYDDASGTPIGVYKCIPYSRDNRCSSNTGPHPTTVPDVAGPPFGDEDHNHYAPYYSRWLPATNAPAAEASGNDGPQVGNNFPGYRGVGFGGLDPIPGLYDYWQPAQILREALGEETDCRRIGDEFRIQPVGPQSLVLYSDEHGEAQAYFNPGIGFFFDNLGVGTNLNLACDLRGVDVLGTADIQAIARYPYQKTTDPDKASNVITKTVGNLFSKEVVCVPKGPVPPIENSLAFICTATAIDIDGTPFVNEKVCFMTNGEGARPFPLGTPGVVEGLHRLCVFTNAQGQASIEVFGKCVQGNVIVEFVDEGIIRFATFTFGCPPGAPGGTQAGAAAANGVNPGTLVPGVSTQATQQAIQQAQVTAAAAKKAAKAKKATLAFARIQKKPFARSSQRYIVLRVNGTAKTARVQITLVATNGRVIGKVKRTVRTNRVVKVPNLKLPKAVKTARVKVLA